MAKNNRIIGYILLLFVIMGLGFFLFISLVLNGILFAGLTVAGSGRHHPRGEAVDEKPDLIEEWSYGSGEVKAARIPIEGLIMRDVDQGAFMPSYDMVQGVIQQIRAARNDDDVRAIILEINTPGGALTPSDEIYHELRLFKNSSEDRIIVVHMKDVAASAGYYISMTGDWIIAEPTSVIGSIGVIMQTLNWHGLSGKIGVTDVTIVSGKNKDLLNPFKLVSPEQKDMIQQLVDQLYERFFRIVAEGRGLSQEQLEPYADGAIFTAQGALDADLIDEIGYWDSVVEKTRGLLGVEKLKVIRYQQEVGLFDWLYNAVMPLRIDALGKLTSPQIARPWLM